MNIVQCYFKFPLCFRDAMQTMTNNEKAAFCDAILDYVFLEEDDVGPIPRSIEPYFILVRPYLDSEKKRIAKG